MAHVIFVDLSVYLAASRLDMSTVLTAENIHSLAANVQKDIISANQTLKTMAVYVIDVESQAH